jgi:hypothetical protein
MRALYTANWRIFFNFLKLLFWFDLFSLFFCEICRHQKDILKLTDLKNLIFLDHLKNNHLYII